MGVKQIIADPYSFFFFAVTMSGEVMIHYTGLWPGRQQRAFKSRLLRKVCANDTK